MEWTFKKAITIQTYSSYDPIPVPLNLVSSLSMAVWWLWKKCRRCCKGHLDIQNSAARHVSCSACLAILTRNFITLIRLVKTKETYFLNLSYYSLRFWNVKNFQVILPQCCLGLFITVVLIHSSWRRGMHFFGGKRGKRKMVNCVWYCVDNGITWNMEPPDHVWKRYFKPADHLDRDLLSSSYLF